MYSHSTFYPKILLHTTKKFDQPQTYTVLTLSESAHSKNPKSVFWHQVDKTHITILPWPNAQVTLLTKMF